MNTFIGYPLDIVLKKLADKEVEICYNTENTQDKNSLYVTKILEMDSKYIVTVSSFKIEVE